jgi:predicted Rossmann fold flavoprotein
VSITSSKTYDAIVLGAGGAGMMCAAVAGQRGQRVLLIDHAPEPGKKILISGGGRCNFTNLEAPPSRYLSDNPHFAKSALNRYKPEDFIALVESHGIAWHEKTLGQLFCDGSARQIVAMLLDECMKGQVTLSLGHSIRDVRHADGTFHVRSDEATVSARALVLATGGRSIPKMGATGLAYDLASQFGLGVITPRPALVPLTLGDDEILFRSLSGVSADVVARCAGTEFRESALFTHKGLSGPAILQISSYWTPGQDIGIDFLPARETGWLVAAKSEQPRATLRAVLAQSLPGRLAETLAGKLDLGGTLTTLSDRRLRESEWRLANWLLRPSGSEGFAKAEVTAGGISTADLSSQSMEAGSISGLYAIGEAVDVTGWLGGYNFQWAWASGQAAGRALAAKTS